MWLRRRTKKTHEHGELSFFLMENRQGQSLDLAKAKLDGLQCAPGQKNAAGMLHLRR